MKCFFHRQDLDGQCSGAIVKSKFPICELVGINYGEDFPWDTVSPDEIVYMVDFSLPLEDMKRLQKSCEQFIWIDHHDTAIEEMKGVDFDGLQQSGIGACALVWEYIMKDTIPLGVRLLAEYDVWNHTDSRTLPFQSGVSLEYTHPNNRVFWDMVFESNHWWVTKIVTRGKIILNKEKQINRSYLKAYGIESMFEGYSAVILNRGMVNSKAFDSLDKDYDLMITFVLHRDRYWKVTLYSNKEHVHCGDIAKKYGGGGHKGAAGFHSTKLPSEFLEV